MQRSLLAVPYVGSSGSLAIATLVKRGLLEEKENGPWVLCGCNLNEKTECIFITRACSFCSEYG
jgi:hypothetical protein